MNKIKDFIRKHKVLSVILISILTIVLVLVFTTIMLFTSTTNNKSEVDLYIYPNTTYKELCSKLQKQNIINDNIFEIPNMEISVLLTASNFNPSGIFISTG